MKPVNNSSDDLSECGPFTRIINISQNKNVVLPPPPKIFSFEVIHGGKNKTQFPTRPGRLRSPFCSFTTPVCEPELLVDTITSCLNSVGHMQYEYKPQLKTWIFKVGYPRKRMSFNQRAFYEAAIAAFYKFPDRQTDSDNRSRQIQYLYYIGCDSDETMLPCCVGEVAIFYDPSKNNIIIETHKYDSEFQSAYTRQFISDKVREALAVAGLETFNYECNKYEK